MSKISNQTRRELIEAVASRYRESGRGDKTLILDEFVRVTKLHRKYALKLLGTQKDRAAVAAPTKSRSRVYDEAVSQSLVILWEASDRICRKRLKPLLPQHIESLTGVGAQSRALNGSGSGSPQVLGLA